MSNQNYSWKNFIASITAGVVSIFTFNSLDTVRVRWQVIDQGAFKSITTYGAHVLKTEGFIYGLQLPAMTSNMLAVGCSTGIRLGIYPLVRETISGKVLGKDVPASAMFSAGMFCGMLCKSPTNG